jgi:hypothetical protein
MVKPPRLNSISGYIHVLGRHEAQRSNANAWKRDPPSGGTCSRLMQAWTWSILLSTVGWRALSRKVRLNRIYWPQYDVSGRRETFLSAKHKLARE